jgi:beta-lactamase regulating signal transducer with metallopeptidase domain
MPTIVFTLLWNIGLATVLAILVGLLSRSMILRHQPRLMHALWLLVLAKLITPPLIPLPVLPGLKEQKVVEESQLRRFESNFVGSDSSPIGQKRTGGNLATTDERIAANELLTNPIRSLPWSAILVGISGCGTLILITASLSQLWRLSRVLRRAASGDVRLNGLSQSAASRMGMQEIPVVCAVDASITPLLWVRPSGPVIVMPTGLAERMSDEQITCIFCHELAHYMRRDHWSNAFAFLVAALFWWHPVAWWARREMRAAQEVCCDGLALATGAATRRCYAETLFQTLEFVQTNRSFQPALVSGFGGSSSLQRRFEMIASQNVSRRFSRCATVFLVASTAAMLCLPVRGQSPKESAQQAQAPLDETHLLKQLQDARRSKEQAKLDVKRLNDELKQLENTRRAKEQADLDVKMANDRLRQLKNTRKAKEFDKANPNDKAKQEFDKAHPNDKAKQEFYKVYPNDKAKQASFKAYANDRAEQAFDKWARPTDKAKQAFDKWARPTDKAKQAFDKWARPTDKAKQESFKVYPKDKAKQC